MTTRRFIAGGAIVLLVTMGAGCGKVTEKVTQKASEKAIEKSVGGDAKVDIDSKTGKVKIKDKEGGSSYEYDGEGNMEFKDKDGNSSYSAGKNTKLPADWPKAMALPKGFKLVSSVNTTSNGTKTQGVTASGSGDSAKVLSKLESQLKSAGYEIGSNSASKSDDGFYGSVGATKGNQNVTVMVMESDGETVLTMGITTEKS